MQPFTCPHCGGHDYSIVLTGCTVKGATLEEDLTWDLASQDYVSTGSVILESESVENATAQAFCLNCQKDVTEAVAAWESSPTVSGSRNGA